MPEEAADPILGPRFEEAFSYACKLHRTQARKGTRVPYLAHLLGVAALVLEDGGNEDEAIAALLHDAVQHQTDIPILNEIRRRFGSDVAGIVEGCADHDPAKDRPSWEVRKRAYIDSLPQQSASCLRVMLADKLFNARELLADYRQSGEQVWTRFSAGREMLRYLRALAEKFQETHKSPMADELDRVVRELERMAEVTAPAHT